MIKKLLGIAVVAVAAKFVLNKLTGKDDADLWAEATDRIKPNK
ncbi:MAG: DLW-39 family protein [Nocardioidaceae bacterium]